jgi:hypothetical protein
MSVDVLEKSVTFSERVVHGEHEREHRRDVDAWRDGAAYSRPGDDGGSGRRATANACIDRLLPCPARGAAGEASRPELAVSAPADRGVPVGLAAATRTVRASGHLRTSCPQHRVCVECVPVVVGGGCGEVASMGGGRVTTIIGKLRERHDCRSVGGVSNEGRSELGVVDGIGGDLETVPRLVRSAVPLPGAYGGARSLREVVARRHGCRRNQPGMAVLLEPPGESSRVSDSAGLRAPVEAARSSALRGRQAWAWSRRLLVAVVLTAVRTCRRWRAIVRTPRGSGCCRIP